MSMMDDTAREIYARQISMKEIGEKGQQVLAGASVLVVGCGGLGTPVLNYLTAMGIGRLGLCDGDTVSLSNLNRQLLYTMEDLGEPKATVAEKRLKALNPKLKTTIHPGRLNGAMALELLSAYDIAVDCLDNFPDRFVLNDACVATGKPFVHAGIGEFYGQLLTVTPANGPCLRCLFPHGHPGHEPAPPPHIIGATAGVVGALQALEVLKYLLSLPVNNKHLLLFDGLNMRLDKTKVSVSPDCVCHRSITPSSLRRRPHR